MTYTVVGDGRGFEVRQAPVAPLRPVYRNFDESMDGLIIGWARTASEALRVALGAGVRGLKGGGKPKLLEYVGGDMWLLED